MDNNIQQKIQIIRSAYQGDAISMIEMDVAPKTGNPSHYHSLFSETFEVLSGELFVGKNKQTVTLKKGEKVKINLGENHFFKNKTEQTCRIRVTLEPANADFEDAMLIYYGLGIDGLLTQSGTPKNISDLAIFIYLNNSKMRGFGKIIEYVFAFIAKRAIHKGRLAQLKSTYCINKLNKPYNL